MGEGHLQGTQTQPSTKVIFKVIKPNHRLPSPRFDSEDKALAEWSAKGDGV